VADVRLRPMTAEEFGPWRASQIEDYADDILRNGRYAADTAHDRAREAFDRLLTAGLGTTGHAVWIAENPTTGERVGFLWLGPSDEPTRAWVYTIEVDEPLRGRGYGRALMLAFEEEARARGYESVGLNVFGHNEAARHLYESLGYAEVARQMAKPLSGGGRGPSGGGA
jgi:ribosomal protein S18 acetylase RimI-like enzyme